MDGSITAQLLSLTSLHKQGELNDSEYAQAKRTALTAQADQQQANEVSEEDEAEAEDQELVTVTCPDDANEGDMVDMELEGGRAIQVEIPEGVEPGDTFQIVVHSDIGGGVVSEEEGLEADDDEAEAEEVRMR